MTVRDWLIIATLPGSGSTALARFSATQFNAGFLGPDAEGMWTVPDFDDYSKRWVPEYPRDLSPWRAQWLKAEAALPDGAAVVEKSPPNLARMARLVALFPDRRVTLIRLTRDPFAVGSNWIRCYTPDFLVTLHRGQNDVSVATERDLLRFVGDAVGRRMTLLCDLNDVAATIRYEDFVSDWQAVVSTLRQACPGLVLRADPEPMEIYDSNIAARASLSEPQAEWFAEGIAPYTNAVESLGYDPMPPGRRSRPPKRPGIPTFLHGDDAAHRPGSPPIGRRVAWAGFLDAVAQHGSHGRVGCLGLDYGAVTEFAKRFAARGYRGAVSGACLTGDGAVGTDVLVLPDPLLCEFAWRRARALQPDYSLCGIIHGASDVRVARELRELVSAPVEAYDALICPSEAVKRVVSTHLEAAAEYLSERFGCAIQARVQLPVLPLGIAADAHAVTDAQRAAAREALGIDHATCAVLCRARLSVLEKFHPSALFQSVAIAAKTARAPITLVVAGWFASQADEAVFRSLASEMAAGVDIRFVDGETALAYAAADLFVLPAESIQESFGLAPLEAMAATLPVIVPDWNGLAETVEDGVTGFTIPTLMAPPGTGLSIARRHADGEDGYLSYLGQVQQRVAVDIAAMGAAIAALADAPDRRRAMGEAGHARVRENYDWRVLLPRYERLWATLSEERRRSGDLPVRDMTAIDPFTAFAGYATGAISEATRFTANGHMDAAAIERLAVAVGDDLVGYSVADGDTMARVASAVVGAARSVAEIAEGTGLAVPEVSHCALWLLKHGVLLRADPP